MATIEETADKLAQTTEIGIKVLLAGPGVKEKATAGAKRWDKVVAG